LLQEFAEKTFQETHVKTRR